MFIKSATLTSILDRLEWFEAEIKQLHKPTVDGWIIASDWYGVRRRYNCRILENRPTELKVQYELRKWDSYYASYNGKKEAWIDRKDFHPIYDLETLSNKVEELYAKKIKNTNKR